MSVVVRMEMPEGCWGCPFGHYDWIWGDDGREKMVCFCCLDGESEEDGHYLLETEEKRPSWCPIICQLPEFFDCDDKLKLDAAAAIEDLEARLGEAENSVENYKRMWLEKHEPKTARWEGWTSTHWSKRCDSNGDPIYTEHTYYQCSYCGRRTVVRENFCPNCGAVMEDMCEVQE